jgi:5-methylthioadenosine/S-adenosylhomocysteine deaminase
MASADTVILARWIIPIEPENTVLEHHAVIIQDGRIRAILPEAEALACFSESPIERLPNHVLIPGLINTHTHAAMTLMRGIADDKPLMDWLTNHIWPLEQRWVNEAFVRDGVDLAMAEMIRGGITTFNDMYFFPEVTAQQAVRAGMRAMIGMIVVDFPTAWAGNADEYIDKGLALRDAFRHEPRVRFAFAPHAPYTVSDEPLSRIRMLADELELPIHMHIHETAEEIEGGQKSHGMRPLNRLHQLGLLGPNLMAVHMTQLEADEIALLAETGVSVIHCPESNLKLASGFCPVAQLLDAGINVALGTDGAASNNDLDLLGEMRTAALLAKAVSGNASALPAPAALSMATLGGAKALGIDQETGSLIPGKWADLVALRLDSLETQPLFNPISDLVYAASRHLVTDVWIEGRRVLENRELKTLDEADIQARTRYWRDRLVSDPNPTSPH